MERFVLSARRKIRAVLIAMLTALLGAAVGITPAFADFSPQFDATTASTRASAPIQLAEANIGGIDDYMHQSGDGPSGAAVPAPGYAPYQPQTAPPQGYYSQPVPPPEWNNSYADPNAARSALIGAAVVGAIAVGLWAWQQHATQQAQAPAPARKTISFASTRYRIATSSSECRCADLSKDRKDALAQDQRTGSDARQPRRVEIARRESKYFRASRKRCRSRPRIRHCRQRRRAQRGPRLRPGANHSAEFRS